MTFARVGIARPAALADAPEPERAQALLGVLLKNVYRAFDFREETDVYDKLSQTVGGDLLAELYLQNRRSFAIQQAGGAQAKIKSVEVRSAAAERLPGRPLSFAIRADWEAQGSVGHWGPVATDTMRWSPSATSTVPGRSPILGCSRSGASIRCRRASRAGEHPHRRRGSGFTDRERRDFRIRNIGLVFQDFALIDYLDVLDNILHPYRITGALRLTRQVRERAADLAAAMGVGDKLHRSVARLSQGEQQRVAICRALLPSPALVLADEATGNLDPRNKGRILDLLFASVVEHGATLLAVTHDHDLLPRFDRVVDFAQFRSDQTRQPRH